MDEHDPMTNERCRRPPHRRRTEEPGFARWAEGHGVIRHRELTRIHEMATAVAAGDRFGDGVNLYELLHALDRLASARDGPPGTASCGAGGRRR